MVSDKNFMSYAALKKTNITKNTDLDPRATDVAYTEYI